MYIVCIKILYSKFMGMDYILLFIIIQNKIKNAKYTEKKLIYQ